VWMRKRLVLPESMHGKSLRLSLGVIDDADITYVNGQEVGQTPITTPASYTVSREYTVPASLTRDGHLLIAVRVFDHFGGGGMNGDPNAFFVQDPADPAVRVAIRGAWKAKVHQPLDPMMLRDAAIRGPGRGAQYKPGYLYNGMIHPIAPYAHRGVIWYQGEANAGRAENYRTLMPMLIADWRALWNQEGVHHDFAFLQVQLANLGDPSVDPSEEGWGGIRDAQFEAASTQSNGYIATAIDIGEADDIHPRNKQEVGRRLGLIALRRVYGKSGFMDQGPVMTRATMAEGEVRLEFEYASGLKTTDGQDPRGFKVQDAQGQWHWAHAARIDGESVVVTAPEGVQAAVKVRYAWAMNPVDGPHGINLVNGEGLPAFPFEVELQELRSSGAK